MFKRAAIGVLAMLLVFAGRAIAENQGSSTIVLQVEDYDSVQFSHLLHQVKLGDCKVCHDLYDQETGAIDKSVRAGGLTHRQVMDQCMDCHRETAIAGEKSGPTSCRGCHLEE